MGKKIVIVDAEPIVRSTIAAILESDGHEVTQTNDPMSVVEMTKSDPPALIITNVSLPGISGHDAMALFKQCLPGTPVLMVPGVPESEVITKWRGKEGFEIFPKPFVARDLQAKVREILGGGVSRRENS